MSRFMVILLLVDCASGLPETEKAQPELTDWAWLWFVAEWLPPPIAYFRCRIWPPFIGITY